MSVSCRRGPVQLHCETRLGRSSLASHLPRMFHGSAVTPVGIVPHSQAALACYSETANAKGAASIPTASARAPPHRPAFCRGPVCEPAAAPRTHTPPHPHTPVIPTFSGKTQPRANMLFRVGGKPSGETGRASPVGRLHSLGRAKRPNAPVTEEVAGKAQPRAAQNTKSQFLLCCEGDFLKVSNQSLS